MRESLTSTWACEFYRRVIRHFPLWKRKESSRPTERIGDPRPTGAQAIGATRNASQANACSRLALVRDVRKAAGQRIGRLDRSFLGGPYFFKRPFFKRPFFTRNPPSASLKSPGFSIIKKWPTPSQA